MQWFLHGKPMKQDDHEDKTGKCRQFESYEKDGQKNSLIWDKLRINTGPLMVAFPKT
jgi:hypothetical protein